MDALNKSGILNGYEYCISKLIENSFPEKDIFKKCSMYILEYSSNLNRDNLKAKSLRQLYNEEIDEMNRNNKELIKIEEESKDDFCLNERICLKSSELVEKYYLNFKKNEENKGNQENISCDDLRKDVLYSYSRIESLINRKYDQIYNEDALVDKNRKINNESRIINNVQTNDKDNIEEIEDI